MNEKARHKEPRSGIHPVRIALGNSPPKLPVILAMQQKAVSSKKIGKAKRQSDKDKK